MNTTQLQILAFEDNPEDSALLESMLGHEQREKITLTCVTNPKEGFSFLKSSADIDLILLDLSMANGRGLETLRTVHTHSPSIPVIVLTRQHDDELSVKAVQTGAQDYLVKGEFDQHHLLRAIRHSVERKRAEAERKRLEAHMQYAQKLESLGVLAGGIAHDFNNLLMAIVARAGLALRAVGDDSPAYAHLKHIEQSGLRGGELANQMLTYAGRGKPIIQTVNVSQLIKDMAHLLRVSLSKECTVRYDLADPQLPIEADPSQLRQLVMSVTANASEAMANTHGDIVISTGAARANVTDLSSWYVVGDVPKETSIFIEVSDNGIGMDHDMLPKIFDPFFSTKFMGRGLSLAALLGIMRAHNGCVAVRSRLGAGTQFRLYFPAAAPQQAAHPSPPADGAWMGSGTVLVVDDEEDVRIACQLILEEVGFTVLTATDGIAGLDMFTEHQNEITAVLLDLTMPRMDGERLFKEIRQLNATIPILLSSGYTEEDAAKRFQGMGLYSFIQKPYQISALINKVREAIERTSAS